MGFLGAISYAQLVSAVLFYPLMLYFAYLIIPRNTKAIALPKKKEEVKKKPEKTKDGEVLELKKEGEEKTKFDIDRRAFIKLIGSAGMSIFLLSIFTKKAQGAFFGSVPGPGTVAVKNIAGDKIDPSEKHPTDGYRVADMDDSSPAYYGFTDLDGNWFIIKEDTDGSYKYVRGASSYTSNWTTRSGQSYDYYDVVF